MEPVLFQI